MDWSLSEGLMHKGIIRLLKGVFMSIEDVVNVLKDAGFCGDEHTLFKEDVSISLRYSTIVIAYKFGIVSFSLDGLYIEYNCLGMLSIFGKCGSCMALAI